MGEMAVVVETDPLPYMLVTTIVCDILVLFILVRAMLDIYIRPSCNKFSGIV
jgi:hypothetical protein